MRGITALATLALLVGAVGVSTAEPYILNLSGNNFSITEAAAIGGELEVVGMLSQVQDNPPFSVPGIIDWSTEYTVSVRDLILASPPSNSVKTYTGGVVELWSETPPDAPWTPTTPVSSIPALNAALVPARMIDGSPELIGVFTQFATLFFGGQTGSISATIDWTGGTRLADLQALGIANDWHWNGWFNLIAPVPGGYQRVYGGKLEHETPVAVEPATWGEIKNLWRAE
jgi:hypothetical protein